MRIRARFTPLATASTVGVLALALSLAAPPVRAADVGAAKSFKEHNFQWTLPSAAWNFEEVLEENQTLGFVAAARRTVSSGVEVSAMVRVVECGGAGLDSLMSQTKDAKSALLSDIVKNELVPATWAGVRGNLLTLKGKFSNGSVAMFRIYGAIVDGKFHMLSIRIMNAAEEKIASEIDALVDGYRFLKGGTPPRPEGGAAGMDDAGGAEPGMDGGEAPAPSTPDSGGSGDGRKKKFPNLALSWSSPAPAAEADKPTWKWATNGNPDIPRTGNGLAAEMALQFADGSTPITVELSVQPAKPGWTPEGIVDQESFQQDLMEKNFSNSPAPIPKTDEDVKIGNANGAGLVLTGKDKGDPPKPLQIREYFVVLQRTVFQIVVVSREGAEKTSKAEIRAALDGLTWDNPKQGLRGPLASPIPIDMEARGDFADKEYDVKVTKAHGFTLTKPAGFAMLKIDGGDGAAQYHDHQVLWFAAEARREGLYCFFSVSTYFTRDFLEVKPAKDPESLIDEIESAWKSAVTEPATRPKSDKTNRTGGGFGTGRGSTYEFRGNVRGVPYLERGFMVKAGQNWHLIREQFGGKDAEAAFANDLKAMTKTVKFE